MTLSEASRVLEEQYPRGFDPLWFHSVCRQVKRVVILRTSWYPEVIDPLLASAKDYFLKNEVPVSAIEVMHVPGSFELPLAAKLYAGLAAVKRPEIIIALGCVLRGDTPHFDYVCQAVTMGINQVALESQIPIGFGVLTVDTIEQAKARKDKGAEAAQAALAMHLLKTHLQHHQANPVVTIAANDLEKGIR